MYYIIISVLPNYRLLFFKGKGKGGGVLLNDKEFTNSLIIYNHELYLGCSTIRISNIGYKN